MLRDIQYVAHSSRGFRTPPSQGGDHRFESGMRYQIDNNINYIGKLVLFSPERFNRIEAGGIPGGEKSKE